MAQIKNLMVHKVSTIIKYQRPSFCPFRSGLHVSALSALTPEPTKKESHGSQLARLNFYHDVTSQLSRKTRGLSGATRRKQPPSAHRTSTHAGNAGNLVRTLHAFLIRDPP